MFNSLKGELTFKDTEKVFMETGGVEWKLHISRSTCQALGETGTQIRIFTFLYHREDRMMLYGFAETPERDLFLDLIKVEGIGPSLALKILSGMKVTEFLTALDTENLTQLTSIPGLGKKTAQKIIFKLRGKLSRPEPTDPLFKEILGALTGMGFDPRQARKVLEQVHKELADSQKPRGELEKEMIKQAITKLGNN